MTKKRLLIIVTFIMFAIGMTLLSVPFTSSLGLSEKSDALLERIDLTEIQRGTYTFAKHPGYEAKLHNGYFLSVLIYKKHNGDVKVWSIPTKNGNVGMPDVHWWKPVYECRNFGPTMIDGLADESNEIKCHDNSSEVGNWPDIWHWDINGKNKINKYSDLQETVGTVEGNYFVFRKTS
jgi:hypothetical protein